MTNEQILDKMLILAKYALIYLIARDFIGFLNVMQFNVFNILNLSSMKHYYLKFMQNRGESSMPLNLDQPNPDNMFAQCGKMYKSEQEIHN